MTKSSGIHTSLPRVSKEQAIGAPEPTSQPPSPAQSALLEAPPAPLSAKPSTVQAPATGGAVGVRTQSAVAMLNTAALTALRDVEKGGKKGTPPPMVARAMFYVSAAIAEVYRREPLAAAEKTAKSVTAQVLNGLLGQSVMADPKPRGGAIAEEILARAAKDGADRAGEPRAFASTDRPIWTPVDAAGAALSPLLPSMGRVNMVVEANQGLRASPPRFTDDDWREFFAGQKNLSGPQVTCAKFWADGPGTYTPPGHWNTIATECATLTGMSGQETAQLLAALNAALLDAGISCWDTKFTHGGERPFQAAKRLGIEFTPVLGTPPFPGYTSGHATFSGAAGEVLGLAFDSRGKADALRDRLAAHAQLDASKQKVRDAKTAVEMFAVLASEAADSRVLGGIHIAHDGTEGVRVGREIGRNVYAAFLSEDA